MSKKKFTYTNSAGECFDLLPANPLEEQIIKEQLEAEWKASGKALPELPTYEVKSITGEVQHIQVDSREKAESAGIGDAWTLYQQAQDAFNSEYGDRFLTSCFLCVNANPDDFRPWKLRMKALKIPIPDDEADKLILFCKTWVIRSKDDIPNLIFYVTRTIANVDEGALKAAEDKFRALLEEAPAK